MEVKVIEPIKNYLKEFNTPVEFNLWYSKNKNEVDSLTTHKLNKIYFIKDYRITKIKGELMLKPDTKSKIKKEEEEINELTELRNEIKTIKDTLNKLIEYVNNNLKPITEQ